MWFIACYMIIGILFVPSCSYRCNSTESCTGIHLNSVLLQNALVQRCTIDASTLSHNRRTIAFTHVPKSGGATVSTFLRKYVNDRRLKGPAHEPYPSTLMRKQDSLFYITLLRHPLARVLSLYQYIVMHKSLRIHPPPDKNNYLWFAGERSQSIVEWLNDTRVVFDLSRVLPRMFVEPYDKDVSFDKHYIAKANYSFPFPYEPYIPIDYRQFLNYTHEIPEPYHCRHHMKVILLLLQRYEVVGVLEQFADFWTVFFQRAELPSSLYKTALAIHSNKSRKVLSTEEKRCAEEILDVPLYCSTLVWRVAKMISDKDKTCFSESS